MTIGQESPPMHESNPLHLLEALPVAIYTTDATGKITFYNRAAAELAGRRPQLGSDEWCVTWRLYQPDGTPLPHHKCPMAVAVQERRPVRGQEAVAERPDGTRVPFRAYPTPLYSGTGEFVGAVNLLMDISDQKRLQAEAQRVRSLNEKCVDPPDSRETVTNTQARTEAAAGEQTDPLTILIGLLHGVIASDADPYLLAGALVEGIATTFAQKIPSERHSDVALGTVYLLRDRMRYHGLI